jgi:uncharacterized protein
MAGVVSDDGQYRTRVHASPHTIDAGAWDTLLAAQTKPTPFMRWHYLAALHDSASAVAETGWAPQFLTLEDDAGAMRAGCALYLKGHSYGEYVFDWAWADAYRRHGLRYYPKLLGAVPFTPVPGARLLAADAVWRARLARAVLRLAEAARLSSAHLLFTEPEDTAAFEALGFLVRHGVQFHWRQDVSTPVANFTELLARMQREKRKKIQQERRRVADAGVSFGVAEGAAISSADWDYFYLCYERTYAAHGGTPYLTRDFFARMACDMPEHWLMFTAQRAGAPVAASLIAIDRPRRAAWGRYWGSTEDIHCLHFEACYYQPLAWCIDQGFTRFEGGAQGEHKMARGLLPVQTASVHWLRDARFAEAVGDFLAREGQGIAHYIDELRERDPFKAGAP